MPELRSIAHLLHYVAADPDPEEAAKLQGTVLGQGVTQATVFETALGSTEGPADVHLTADRGGSSLLCPRGEVYEEFGHGAAAEVERIERVSVRRLESVLDEADIQHVDMLKVDTQGTELDILKSLDPARVSNLLFFEAEVEFRELYVGQPLFRHLDEWASDQGFALLNINRVFWNFGEGRWRAYGRGQLVHGDVHYVRADHEHLSPERVARLITVCHLYGYADYGRHVYRCARERLGGLPGAVAEALERLCSHDRQSRLERVRTVANLFGDRVLRGLLSARRWNGLAADTDRNYPVR